MNSIHTDKDAYLSDFSSHLREELTRRGETAKTLSEGTGIAASNISSYLSGRKNGQFSECGIFNLVRIADYLGVSADYLLGRTPVRAPDPDKTLETIRQYTGLSEGSIEALHNPAFPFDFWDILDIPSAHIATLINRIIETGSFHSAMNKIANMEEYEEEQSCRLAAFEAVEIFTRFVTECRDEQLRKLLGGAENERS